MQAAMQTQDQDILSMLNEAQRAAVESPPGPLLILAGAGTGKTRVLTTRMAHLMHVHHAPPASIFAATFTNKAANEMRHRLQAMIGPHAENLWIGTFHSLALRILRAHCEKVGLRPQFTILDNDDQMRLIKQVLEDLNIDPKAMPPQMVLSVISRWKDRALTPEGAKSSAKEGAQSTLLKCYENYQQRLQTLNAADFGDLILYVIQILKNDSAVLERYRNQFQHVLVDEYQDTNVAQYLWMRLFASGPDASICCVGDDDQSIYSWRGAEVGNILRFEKDYPGATVVRLEQNYRSTPHILGAANHLIAHNQQRFPKTLWTADAEGEKVQVIGVWDSDEEARLVLDEVENLQRKGSELKQMAILLRAGFQTRAFEDRCIETGVPYRVVGGLRFYERREIRDALAYLRIINNLDDGLAFERIVNLPRRGLGAVVMKTLHEAARREGISIALAGQRLCATDELRSAARTSLRNFLQQINYWQGLAMQKSPAELAETVLDQSGYTEMWQKDTAPDAPGRLENLKELVQAIAEYPTLGAFLEHVSLVAERAETHASDELNIMTLHMAKGLEFTTVFLPGWEESLLPHPRAIEETGAKGLEEERRLAYVGLTRAKRYAMISYASHRKVHFQWQSSLPSRFLDELPAAHIERKNMVAYGQHYPNLGARQGVQRGGRWGGLQQERARPEIHLNRGQQVFHLKFGHGMVLDLDGDYVGIEFEKAGYKRVMKSFVETNF